MNIPASVALALLVTIVPQSSQAQMSAPEQRAAIEGAQTDPGNNPLAAMTIQELMDHFNVPGVSIAVIRDFKIHWLKGTVLPTSRPGRRSTQRRCFRPLPSVSR